MLFNLSQIWALLMLLTQTWACGVPSHVEARSEGNVTYPYTVPGDERASDPATNGYLINHLCINARNATASVEWYTNAFGLRLIFTLQVSEHFSITYMGHAQGGRNGTGYQTSEEMNRDKNNSDGLLEIISLEFPGWDLPSGLKVPNTFSHIGLVVSNITDTYYRLQRLGIDVIKAPGAAFEIEVGFATVTGFNQAGGAISKAEREMILKTLGPLNRPLMFVADPDGNIIEVQNQEGSGVVM